MTQKRMGRPPKSGDENLSELVQVRVTATDKAELDRAAAHAGLKLSDWMRDRLRKVARREVDRAEKNDAAGG